MAQAQYDKKQYLMVSPGDIVVKPELNPRVNGLDEDNLEAIFHTIHEKGIEVPVECRKEGDKLVLVFGFHRHEAAVRYNKHNKGSEIKIPVIVKEINEEEAFNRAISENRDRKAMSAMDHAHAQNRLMSIYGWSIEEVANSYDWEVEKVTNTQALLRLPKKIQKMVAKKELPVITAIDMAKTMTPEEMETALEGAERIGATGRIKGESIRKVVKEKKAEAKGEVVARSRKELVELLEGLTGPAEPELLAKTAKILVAFASGKYKDEVDAENRLRAAHGETTPRPPKAKAESVADKPKPKPKKAKTVIEETPEPVESLEETPEPV